MQSSLPVQSGLPVLTPEQQRPLMSPPPPRSRLSSHTPVPSPSPDSVAARTRSRSRSTTPVKVTNDTGDGRAENDITQVRRQLDLIGSPCHTAVYSDGEVDFDLADLDNIDASELSNCVEDIHQEDAELVQIELNDNNNDNDNDWVFTQEVVSTKNVPKAPAYVKRVLSPEIFSLNRSASDFSASTSGTKSTKKKQKVDKTVSVNSSAKSSDAKRRHRSSTGSTASSDSVQIMGTSTCVKAVSSVAPPPFPTADVQTSQPLAKGRSRRMP